MFFEILINYILPIIYNSSISLILVLFILFIFRIKDSNIRILFLFLPLIKPFLIIIEKINLNEEFFKYRPGVLGIRLPSPNTIINRIDSFHKSPVSFSNMNYLIMTLIISSIIFALIIRWINLYLFYKNLSYEEKVERKDVTDIFNIIDKFIEKISIKYPSISLTHKKFFSPFIIGIKNYTLVLSPNLLDKLSTGEKETLIHHELSHVKRKDNLISWIALILRDLLFFNPVAYIAYYLIRVEQEKGSDKLVLIYSKKQPKEIAKNILNIILKIKSFHLDKLKIKNNIYQGASFLPLIKFNQILIKDRINSLIKTKPNKVHCHIIFKITMSALFIILLLVQIILIAKVGNTFVFLR